MAVSKNCSACNKLQEDAPGFVLNGVTSTHCTNLKNNKGFNSGSGNNDCTDLNNANDCLIGNMADEIDAYGVCEWKTFTKNFIENLWNVLKAIICAICGLWTNIDNLWTKVNKQDCEIKYLFQGAEFKIGEEATDDSYIVAGKGVSFLIPADGDPNATDIYMNYIAGGLIRGIGTLAFYNNNFTDAGECWSFDSGQTKVWGKNRQGNSNWTETGNIIEGGELIYEIRVNLGSKTFNTVRSLHAGIGQEWNTGGFHFITRPFTAGQWAYGQHGRCKSVNDPTPYKEGMSYGHKVEDGWIYYQLRMTWVDQLLPNGASGAADGQRFTPTYLGGIRFKRGEIEC